MIRVNKGMGCYKVKGRWKLVYIVKCFGYLVLIIFCGMWRVSEFKFGECVF